MKRSGLISLTMLICSLVLACGSSDTPAPTSTHGGKVLLATYMVGSDLESRHNLATKDMMDMIHGYTQLGTLDRDGLEVLVAFGGSVKPTWNGVRYTDMSCMIQDSADGVFGNDDCYSHTALFTRAGLEEMSDKTTLIHFLNTIQAMAPDYDTVFVNFWNHGNGFKGYGYDENFDLRRLTIAEIVEAFAETGFRPDIIGFDACLMASAEVYAHLHPHADYLVASEEVEPGHGWDYSLLLSNYTADVPELAKRVVDTFIDSPSHNSTKGKTLSVVDTAAYPAFHAGLDDLSLYLQVAANSHFPKLIKSAYLAEKYGDDMSMDLKHFLELFSSVLTDWPALSAKIDGVLADLDATVIYAREDGSRPSANGISVFAMNEEIWTGGAYDLTNSISANWYDFVSDLITHDDEDVLAPVVTTEAPAACGKDSGTAGKCYRIEDDFAVKSAYGILALPIIGNNRYKVLTRTPLERISNEYFYLEAFNRDVLEVCSGSVDCFHADSWTEIDRGQYKFLAIVDGQYANVTVRFADRIYLDHWVAGMYDPDSGTHPKDDGILEPGDGLTPFQQIVYYYVPAEGDSGSWAYSENTLSPYFHFWEGLSPVFRLVDGDHEALEYLIVQDAQGNIGLYDTAGEEVPTGPQSIY
ncbi:clostripain-related cysteine peptidase [Desulfatitalea alkaliphila]|uniref:Clostripain-related cysteine peptidase n=1 Tax=Desulfatitalea alkaliphila TaxID=2929485 RepID=A0AA41R0V8_9BACT|nr:clostripain-related cysteine peptidase [Desulfatitalea alkaliphila]MCJ8500122.1 clostripain-related cysteine peptidase [Desulfatitalea alkaliphila]